MKFTMVVISALILSFFHSIYDISLLAAISENNFFDVIHLGNAMFIMNDNEFSKTYFLAIESGIFSISTYQCLAIKTM